MTDSEGAESQLARSARAVRAAIDAAAHDLIERRPLCELVALAAVAREHVLVVGPPGTAKSAAVRRTAATLGGRYFEYLLSRFTEPSEIFGPIDLRKLRDGVVETQTAGMLPEAEVAFLDEVFLGSTAILNTLLTLLNERIFRRGSSQVQAPLRVCVGASNALPDELALAAFADRFLLHVFVEPIADSQLEVLLQAGRKIQREPAVRLSSLDEIDALANVASEADLSGCLSAIADAVRRLRQAGIALSDRRVVKLQGLVAAAAVVDGRSVASSADLWPIVYALPTAEAQALGRDVLREYLLDASSHTLAAAAEQASHSPLLRAQRLHGQLVELLEVPLAARQPDWHVRLKTLVREVDASIAPESLPGKLAEARRLAVEHILAQDAAAATAAQPS